LVEHWGGRVGDGIDDAGRWGGNGTFDGAFNLAYGRRECSTEEGG
jgi:hypothetical protein